MLQDGREFSYDPNQYRAAFPRDAADEMLGNLEDARTVGEQIKGVHGMSLSDIGTQIAANNKVLSNSTGEDYAKQSRLAKTFATAAEQWTKQLYADPAGAVTSTNPNLQAAAEAVQAQTPEQAAALQTAGQPTAAESFAGRMLAEQERLGLPEGARHVLSNGLAAGMSQQIMNNPEMAPTLMKGLSQTWGSEWPAVWKDLATIGKLPPAYQMVGALDNEADGALLARALGHINKEGNNKAIEQLIDKGQTGTTRPTQMIKESVLANAAIDKYTHSMLDSGASDQQMQGVMSSIELLAQSKVLFHQMTPGQAADEAVQSAIGKFAFLPNGGARVPVDREDAISRAAQATIDTMSLDFLQPPAIYAGQAPGQASAQDWLRQLKASPTWITAGQAIRLMDNGGRFVRGRDGGFVEVPFTAQPPAAAKPGANPSVPIPPF
jgi:hypothetical protein